MKLLLTLFAGLSLMPLAANAQSALKAETAAQAPTQSEDKSKVFNAESFMLDNGMEVVVIPNNRAPVVTHMVWYRVGAADEATGKSGIAHFLEHLMFKGSKQIGGRDLAPGEFSEIVRSLGGNDNAFTSRDYTAYYQSVPAAHLETVMRMEAGRMNGMLLPEDEVNAERSVVIEERKQRTDNDPRGQFGEQLSAAAYINHPYGKPVIGWKHEIEQLNRADAFEFYDKWYAPNNAFLVVSGDVTPGEVFAKAIDIYGKLPKEDVPARLRPVSPELNSKTGVTLRDPAIRQPVVQTLYRGPSIRQNKKESLALDVLAEIMGGGPTSRLYKELVSEQKIASSAGLSYDGYDWDDASVWVYATPLEGASLEDLKAALDKQLQILIKDGVDEDELRDAITRMQDQAIYARDSLTGPAMVIGRALVTGSTLNDVEYWPYDIGGVSAEDVRAVAAKYLNPDAPHKHPPVTGYLLPAEEK